MKNSIPKRKYQRWDGEVIYFTKNCNGCEFYRKMNKDNLCGWGIAFKYLTPRGKLKKCEIKNRQLEKFAEHSVLYLDTFSIKLKQEVLGL